MDRRDLDSVTSKHNTLPDVWRALLAIFTRYRTEFLRALSSSALASRLRILISPIVTHLYRIALAEIRILPSNGVLFATSRLFVPASLKGFEEH